MKTNTKKITTFFCCYNFNVTIIKLLLLGVLLFCGYLFNPLIAVSFALACVFIICERSVNSVSYLLFFVSSNSLFTFNNSYGLNFWVLLVCVFVLVNSIKTIVMLFKKEKTINKSLLIMVCLLAIWFAFPFGRDYKIISVLESFVWLCFFYLIVDGFKEININTVLISASIGFIYSSFVGLFLNVIPYLKNNIIVYYSGGVKRFSGSLINPNIFYCIGILLAGAIFTRILNKRLRPIWLVLEFPILVFSYMSVSKTFILASIAIAVLAVVATIIKSTKYKWKITISMAVIVLLVCGTMVPYAKEYFNRFFNVPTTGVVDDAATGTGGSTGNGTSNRGENKNEQIIFLTTGRAEIWKKYYEHFVEEDKFLTGFGINTAYGYLESNTHNTYLQILYETGIIGILLLISLVAVYLKKTKLEAFKKLNTGWYISWGALAVVCFAENMFLSQIGNMLLLLAILSLRVVDNEEIDLSEVVVNRKDICVEVGTKNTLAILTPSYNRNELLNRVFDSLANQTNKNFVWYVVDDGSTETQEKIVQDFKKIADFDIEYFRKQNGGKHTAINYGLNNISEPLTMILDNDDMLREDAVDTILKDYELIKNNDDLCGIGYLRTDDKSNVVGVKYTQDGVVDTFINQRYNKHTYGDKSEVFKTDILKQYPFPEIEGERFLSESIVWCKISKKYKMVFFNDGIYLCEYMQGGLSDNVRKTLFNNPVGSMMVYNELTTKDFNLDIRCKNTLLYIIHSFACGNSAVSTIKKSNAKFLASVLLPFGWILYLIRKRRFKK